MTDLDLALEAFGLSDLIVKSNGNAHRPRGAERLTNAERQRRWRERRKAELAARKAE